MDRVHPQLYITDIETIRTTSLPDDIDVTVTTCQERTDDNVSTPYYWFNLSDGDDEYGGYHNYVLFEAAADRILTELENGAVVLVHCHRGRSRSVTTSIAALATYTGQSYESIYEQIERGRPQIDPKELLVGHARRYIDENQSE
jgi:protein-tyrosine phosphatase